MWPWNLHCFWDRGCGGDYIAKTYITPEFRKSIVAARDAATSSVYSPQDNIDRDGACFKSSQQQSRSNGELAAVGIVGGVESSMTTLAICLMLHQNSRANAHSDMMWSTVSSPSRHRSEQASWKQVHFFAHQRGFALDLLLDDRAAIRILWHGADRSC